MRNWLREHWTETKLFLSIWLVYAVHVAPAGGVSPNRYVDLVHSIVNEGRFEIDTYHENTIDKAYYNGHYYVGALPGPAFLAVPAYAIFKGLYALVPQSLKDLAGSVQSYKKEKLADSSFYGQVDNTEFFLSQMFLSLTVLGVASALGSVMLFKTLCLLDCERRIALSVTLLYAFGTNIFFYSTVFFSHIFSATLNIAAFHLALVATRSSRRRTAMHLAVGFLAGYSVLVEYPNAFVAVLLGLWLLKKSKGLHVPVALYVLGFMVPILVLMTYNWISFDNPIATPYMYETEANKAFHTSGFFGVTYPHWDRLFSLLLSKGRGIVWFVPISMIGIAGVLQQTLTRGKSLFVALFCGATMAFYLLFYSSYSVWDGGAVFGPRFLIPMLPFLAIGVAFAFELFPPSFIFGVGLVSIFINWSGAQFGFAESPLQHILDIFTHGPSLPVFGAIMTHSTSGTSLLYTFAARYHAILTLALSIGLIGVFVSVFRAERSHDGKGSQRFIAR